MNRLLKDKSDQGEESEASESDSQEEDEDNDPFLSSDEDSPGNDFDQEYREAYDESVVQETCMGSSSDVKVCNSKGGSPRVTKKADSSEKSEDSNLQLAQNGETHSKDGNIDFGESPLNSKGISGKLKKLLSRNTPLSEKLQEEERTSSNRNSGGFTKPVEGKKSIWSQSEPRTTRSQPRLQLENERRLTRASSKNSSSEGSFLSYNVSHRLEEIGLSCGMRKGKTGFKAQKKSCKNGVFSGNQ
ncbi:hypothetical protein L1887_02086 [Cichorium endivia]|nr:hypothetical protein L1887_02086 [Cichorium endivia]